MKKWEYRQLFGYQTFVQLNEQGRNGWELVSQSMCHVGGAFGETRYSYVFKRELSS
jgi:hypothetical protein